MSIPGLWDKLGQGKVIEIAAYATRHFEQHKRPLRIAVDEAIWRYNFYLPPSTVTQTRRNCPPANPNEKKYLMARFATAAAQHPTHFCDRWPAQARTGPRNETSIYNMGTMIMRLLLREMLQNLGVPWHRAPAEAEAECATSTLAKHFPHIPAKSPLLRPAEIGKSQRVILANAQGFQSYDHD
ncbi:hypothetical protein LSUB1_G004840 [Lachnellula subtilissima]|uniref:Uncharacterized protein n=1 Tax=Lachnellula subtilissima TaxID=602034 RepID=A0A8H8RT64_9HELO|nr:hypothetical protein LSUB1_G004840 [Lachnellula subtilissima]